MHSSKIFHAFGCCFALFLWQISGRPGVTGELAELQSYESKVRKVSKMLFTFASQKCCFTALLQGTPNKKNCTYEVSCDFYQVLILKCLHEILKLKYSY